VKILRFFILFSFFRLLRGRTGNVSCALFAALQRFMTPFLLPAFLTEAAFAVFTFFFFCSFKVTHFRFQVKQSVD
jgi:hypothetical protein